MLVPTPIRRIVLLLALLTLSTGAFARPKKQEKTEAHLLLAALGFPGFSVRLMGQGASVLTVNFVDDTHLLVTYGTRGLVTRHSGEQHNDEDRMVAAVLVDIPTGAILARTEWLMHDHGRYLWPLGHGRFLLRIQNSLSTFTPIENLKNGHAFDRVVFAAVPNTVDAVYVATDNELVLVNSSKPQSVKPQVKALTATPTSRPSFSPDAHQLPPRITPNDAPSSSDGAEAHSAEMLSFFRYSGEGSQQSPLEAVPAGTAYASNIVSMPIYSDGYLLPVAQDHYQWHIVFHPFSGKDIPLPAIDTSCAPNMSRVSPTQFIALACRGISTSTMLTAYDLAQHVIWTEPLPESNLPPSIATAPDSGRFAISRVTTNAPPAISGSPFTSMGASGDFPTVTNTQDLRIYQTQTGDLLMKVSPSPVFITGENFDLSNDGMHFAVVNDTAIDVYRLPDLTKGDKEDLADLAKLTPPTSNARISFGSVAGTSIIESSSSTTSEANPPNVVVLGDTNRPTQPPSLLTDGEKPEFQDSVKNQEKTKEKPQ